MKGQIWLKRIHPLQYSIRVSPATEGKATMMLTMMKMRNWLDLRLADLFPRSHFLRTPAGGQHWRQQLIWYGMVCFGMVWYVLIYFDMFWYGMVYFDMFWYGLVWYGIFLIVPWYGIKSTAAQTAEKFLLKNVFAGRSCLSIGSTTTYSLTGERLITSPHKKFQE